MAAIPLNKPLLPITPTQDATGQPTVCHCCGRRAWGIGMNKAKGDPQYLCGECVLLIEDLRKVRRWDVYELQALDGAVEEMGNFIEEKGLTDLAFYDELDQRLLAKSAVVGFVDRLRQLVREGAAPF